MPMMRRFDRTIQKKTSRCMVRNLLSLPTRRLIRSTDRSGEVLRWRQNGHEGRCGNFHDCHALFDCHPAYINGLAVHGPQDPRRPCQSVHQERRPYCSRASDASAVLLLQSRSPRTCNDPELANPEQTKRGHTLTTAARPIAIYPVRIRLTPPEGRASTPALLASFLLALARRAAVEEVRIYEFRDPLPEYGAIYVGPAEVKAAAGSAPRSRRG